MEARYLTDLEWRICHAVNIYVFKNGQDGAQPILVHIPPAKKKNMKTVMNVIQDRVKYPVGYAKYLFRMDGTRVKDPCELEMYNNYVVASNFEKHFKCAAYGRKRSPLLVLNRESKHVRVLKLQNQNYYEWLLKKKAVGEERPAYIYPPYYTNENKLPQDLPVGKMGNYLPGEMHAPGCCYPVNDGGRTYRIDSGQNYMVNTVTVDVSPDMRDLSLVGFRDKRKYKHGQNYAGKTGKILEPTPSDMLNANVLISEETSQEVVSLTTTSETDDQRKVSRKLKDPSGKIKHQSSHQRKSKGQRVRLMSSEEYHHQHVQKHYVERSSVNIETSTLSTQSSQEAVKRSNKQPHHQQRQQISQKKTSNSKQKQGKVKRRDAESPQKLPVVQFKEPGLPPPPPAQFRDDSANLKDVLGIPPPPTQFQTENQEILNFVDRAMHGPNANVATPSQKPFYYSPEKLAEINENGNIQPLELSFTQPRTIHQVSPANPVPTLHPAAQQQWAILQQPQPQQMVQQMYAIESQPGGPGTPTTTTLIPVQSLDPSGLLGNYGLPPAQQSHASTPQFVQGLTIPQGSVQQGAGMIPSLSSQQTLMQNAGNGPQCIVIPNNCIPPPAHPGTQLVALPGNTSQNQLQQVYQLGIVQQPNPQTCIQVDAKAMRQYVDNQKLIECRFLQQQQNPEGKSPSNHRRKQQRQRRFSDGTDVTETEVDIPFTPLKTYRLENPPDVGKSRSSVGQNERCQNPSRYKHERLPKVRSRNVAIQMGYPASARSSRALDQYLDTIRNMPDGPGGGGGQISRSSNLSNHLNNNIRSRSDSMANTVTLGHSFSSLMRTPRAERGRFFLQNTTSSTTGSRVLRRPGNFCSSYSDQYIGLHSRNLSSLEFSPSPGVENGNMSYSEYYGKPARRKLSTNPVLEDLITIPPPSEFRGFPLHSTKHQHDHQLDNNSNALDSDYSKAFNNNSSNHSMYPYTNNDRSQYMYSRYP